MGASHGSGENEIHPVSLIRQRELIYLALRKSLSTRKWNRRSQGQATLNTWCRTVHAMCMETVVSEGVQASRRIGRHLIGFVDYTAISQSSSMQVPSNVLNEVRHTISCGIGLTRETNPRR